MKNYNLPLIIAGIILLPIILLVLSPGTFASRSPYTTQNLRSWIENSELNFQQPPFPPSPEYPMGSDELGRDIWSYIVYGARLTLGLSLLIVLGRFLIALPNALAAAFGNLFARSLIKQFSLVFTAIPALLISIIILKLDFFQSLNKILSVMAFVIVLSAIAWAKLGSLILERSEDISSGL